MVFHVLKSSTGVAWRWLRENGVLKVGEPLLVFFVVCNLLLSLVHNIHMYTIIPSSRVRYDFFSIELNSNAGGARRKRNSLSIRAMCMYLAERELELGDLLVPPE